MHSRSTQARPWFVSEIAGRWIGRTYKPVSPASWQSKSYAAPNRFVLLSVYGIVSIPSNMTVRQYDYRRLLENISLFPLALPLQSQFTVI